MVNIAPEEPGLYFRTSDYGLFKVGPAFIGTVPPNNGAYGWDGNCIGELWIDVTDPDNVIQKVWDGDEWITLKGEMLTRSSKTLTIGPPAVNSIQLNPDGTASFSGKVTTANTSASDPDKTLTTKLYVDGLISDLAETDYVNDSIKDFLTETEINDRLDLKADLSYVEEEIKSLSAISTDNNKVTIVNSARNSSIVLDNNVTITPGANKSTSINGQVVFDIAKIVEAANDSAASNNGVPVGGLYHNAGTIKIRRS